MSDASAQRPRRSKRDTWDDFTKAGPGTPLGAIFRRYWQPVLLSSDLGHGKALTIRRLDEDLTIYRGKSGKPYILDERCAHRQTVLHIGWVEDECLRCFFHGWKYDGSGQCVEQPAERDAFAAKVRIKSYPTHEYAGLIFAYMGVGSPPPFPLQPELERGFGVQWGYSMIWPCNWFQRIENSFDAVHVSFVHRNSGFGDAVTWTVPELRYEETGYGLRQIATRSPGNIRISDLTWPNNNHIVTPEGPNAGRDPWADILLWFVPVDDEHTIQFAVEHFPVRSEAALETEEWVRGRPRYNPADHHDELFRGNLPYGSDDQVAIAGAQDYIAQIGQGTITDRSKEWLGVSDEGAIFLRKVFRREIEAVKKGLPGKHWADRTELAHLPVPPGVAKPPDD
jgi:5,5'-dehydrodivanillate O-demethylase